MYINELCDMQGVGQDRGRVRGIGKLLVECEEIEW
jgi:hypothetical protein